jgi:hypothetical protein
MRLFVLVLMALLIVAGLGLLAGDQALSRVCGGVIAAAGLTGVGLELRRSRVPKDHPPAGE